MNKKVVAQFLKMLADANVTAPASQKKPTKSGKRQRSKTTTPKDEAAIEQSRLKNNELTVQAFTTAGYTDVQPRVNVLTYGKWEEQGRRVRKGEKSVRVGNFALVHITQTDPITAEAPASA